MASNIAKKLKQLRLQNKLNQTAFGEKIGLDNTYVSKIEAGERDLPAGKLYEIQDIFQLPNDYFFTTTNGKNNTNPVLLAQMTGVFKDLDKDDQLMILNMARRLIKKIKQ